MDFTQSQNKTLWTNCATLFLGFWLLISPASFGYKSIAIATNDSVCGGLIVFFALVSFSLRCKWAAWAACAIGIWLQLAPLVFWAPEATSYLNDTLTGALIIAFSILIPRVGGKKGEVSEIPPGWSYNPSSWLQRIPVIALACVGWFLARYMAAYQLGYIVEVWDPFFGDGTLKVITSEVSKAFPVSDAGLGAAAYTIEALMGCKGGQSRWKTMPWMVIFFGILVVPVGLVSTLLIIMQPLVVGAWCGICLVTAFAMVMMIALTMDEVIATIQFLKRSVGQKKPLWHTFWCGEEARGEKEDWRTPPFDAPLGKIFRAMTWGITLPWTLLLSAILGILLLSLPSLVGYQGQLAASNTIFGALTTVVSIIAMAEIVRKGRHLNAFFGGLIILSSLCLTGYGIGWGIRVVQALLGLALIALSRPQGKMTEQRLN